MDIHNDNHWSLRNKGYQGGRLPEGHEVLNENFTAPQPPVLPCAHQVGALVETVRDLVNAVAKNTSVAPSETHGVFGSGNVESVRKKRGSAFPTGSSGIAPRLIRLRDAPRYLGMDPNRFNAEVRPYLTVIPIGKQGIAFDRIDLDAWAEQYKSCNGRPAKAMKGGKQWDAKHHRASLSEAVSGISRKQSDEREFSEALALATSRKPKST